MKEAVRRETPQFPGVTACVSAAWHVNKSEINEVFANRNLLHGTIPQAADPVVLLRLSTVCLPHGIGCWGNATNLAPARHALRGYAAQRGPARIGGGKRQECDRRRTQPPV